MRQHLPGQGKPTALVLEGEFRRHSHGDPDCSIPIATSLMCLQHLLVGSNIALESVKLFLVGPQRTVSRRLYERLVHVASLQDCLIHQKELVPHSEFLRSRPG
jgi:hypothetical protein